MEKIIALIVLIVLIIIITAIIRSSKRRKAELIRLRIEDSYRSPNPLCLIDCGKIFRVIELARDKVRLEQIKQRQKEKGNWSDVDIVSLPVPALWYSTENIPEDFLKIRSKFELKNENGQVTFYRFSAPTRKIVPIIIPEFLSTIKQT